MKFISIASSSAGNAYIVESAGGKRLLLEAGIPWKRLESALGWRFDNVAGCLITHEHGDHAKAARQVAEAGIPLYCSGGTAAAAGLTNARTAAERQPFTADEFTVLPFRTYHDAAEPLGYYVRADGETLMFATDTSALHTYMDGVTEYALECNFADELIAAQDKLCDKVRERIRGSHMEIGRLCEYIRGADLAVCRKIRLLHLSAACSDERDFVRRVKEAAGGKIAVEACGE